MHCIKLLFLGIRQASHMSPSYFLRLICLFKNKHLKIKEARQPFKKQNHKYHLLIIREEAKFSMLQVFQI